VPLHAYRILRQVTIRFDREWAGQTRADELLRLRDTILERSAKQMATVGDMSKQASKLECEQTFVVSHAAQLFVASKSGRPFVNCGGNSDGFGTFARTCNIPEGPVC
jgi:hypothetical protein